MSTSTMRNHLNSMSERTFRAVILILFCLVFILTLFMMSAGGATASTSTDYSGPRWAYTKEWKPCTSDSFDGKGKRCVWHARRMGNGLGSSYILTNAGKIVRISHHDATILLRPMYGGTAPRS